MFLFTKLCVIWAMKTPPLISETHCKFIASRHVAFIIINNTMKQTYDHKSSDVSGRMFMIDACLNVVERKRTPRLSHCSFSSTFAGGILIIIIIENEFSLIVKSSLNFRKYSVLDICYYDLLRSYR